MFKFNFVKLINIYKSKIKNYLNFRNNIFLVYL